MWIKPENMPWQLILLPLNISSSFPWISNSSAIVSNKWHLEAISSSRVIEPSWPNIIWCFWYNFICQLALAASQEFPPLQTPVNMYILTKSLFVYIIGTEQYHCLVDIWKNIHCSISTQLEGFLKVDLVLDLYLVMTRINYFIF